MGAQRKRRSDRITPRIARAGQSQQAVIPLGPAAILFRLFELPGVVVHEFAHYFFCRLAGSKVHEVVFFSLGNPAGYVVHSVPRHIRQHALIVLGPFLVNTSIAYALFRLQGETGFERRDRLRAGNPGSIVAGSVAWGVDCDSGDT